MGNIDDAVPFFGRGFNKIYPLIMVVYTLLVASNFFVRVIDFLGRWKRFKFQREEENIDGLDPSGMIILQKGKGSTDVASGELELFYFQSFLKDFSFILPLIFFASERRIRILNYDCR
jgi:hypothetical protein